jgi:deoxyribose-phosphate aldolase
MNYTYSDIAKTIDHSLLNPTLTTADLEAGCRLARDYDVASVCIMPYALRRAADLLAGTTVQPSTTIGFPHGGHTTAIKVAEARQALADGGTELDMVVNISKVLSGDWEYVRTDIAEVVGTAHASGAKVKIIFENAYLQDEHKIRLAQDPAVRYLQRSRGRLGEDLHRLRSKRRHHRRSHAHAEARSAARAGEGCRRNS